MDIHLPVATSTATAGGSLGTAVRLVVATATATAGGGLGIGIRLAVAAATASAQSLVFDVSPVIEVNLPVASAAATSLGLGMGIDLPIAQASAIAGGSLGLAHDLYTASAVASAQDFTLNLIVGVNLPVATAIASAQQLTKIVDLPVAAAVATSSVWGVQVTGYTLVNLPLAVASATAISPAVIGAALAWHTVWRIDKKYGERHAINNLAAFVARVSDNPITILLEGTHKTTMFTGNLMDAPDGVYYIKGPGFRRYNWNAFLVVNRGSSPRFTVV